MNVVNSVMEIMNPDSTPILSMNQPTRNNMPNVIVSFQQSTVRWIGSKEPVKLLRVSGSSVSVSLQQSAFYDCGLLTVESGSNNVHADMLIQQSMVETQVFAGTSSAPLLVSGNTATLRATIASSSLILANNFTSALLVQCGINCTMHLHNSSCIVSGSSNVPLIVGAYTQRYLELNLQSSSMDYVGPSPATSNDILHIDHHGIAPSAITIVVKDSTLSNFLSLVTGKGASSSISIAIYRSHLRLSSVSVRSLLDLDSADFASRGRLDVSITHAHVELNRPSLMSTSLVPLLPNNTFGNAILSVSLTSVRMPFVTLPTAANVTFSDCASVVYSVHSSKPIRVTDVMMMRLVVPNSPNDFSGSCTASSTPSSSTGTSAHHSASVVPSDSIHGTTSNQLHMSVSPSMLPPRSVSPPLNTYTPSKSSRRRRASRTIEAAAPPDPPSSPSSPTVDQAGANTATALTLVAGQDSSAAMMLSLLSLLSCSPNKGKASALPTTSYTVSVFFSLGAWQMAVGNLGLICAIGAVHVAGTKAVAWKTGATFTDASRGFARFPSIVLNVAEFLLPGSMFGAVLLLSNDNSNWGEIAIGAVCISLVVCAVAARQVLLWRHVLPQTQWELYLSRPADTWDRAMYPLGRWSPKALRNSFGPLMGPMKRRFALWRISETILTLVISAAAAAGGGGGGAVCTTLVYGVGAVCALGAIACAVARPYRFPMDRYTVPLINALFSVVCFLKAADVDEHVVSYVQSVQSALLVWKMLWMLWISFREAQWEDDADEGRTTRDTGILRSLMSSLWFGGGGLGVSTKNVRFTRLALTDAEELADALSEEELNRDSGVGLDADLIVPMIELNDLSPCDLEFNESTSNINDCPSSPRRARSSTVAVAGGIMQSGGRVAVTRNRAHSFECATSSRPTVLLTDSPLADRKPAGALNAIPVDEDLLKPQDAEQQHREPSTTFFGIENYYIGGGT